MGVDDHFALQPSRAAFQARCWDCSGCVEGGADQVLGEVALDLLQVSVYGVVKGGF